MRLYSSLSIEMMKNNLWLGMVMVLYIGCLAITPMFRVGFDSEEGDGRSSRAQLWVICVSNDNI